MEAAESAIQPRRSSHDSVGGVAAALWRRKFWILVPTLIAFVGSMAIVNVLTPRYTGEARVLLENRETVYSRPDRDSSAGNTSIDPEAVASQVQNVMSKDLALKVIREMGLAKRSEYDPVQKGLGLRGMAMVMLGLQPDPRTIPQEERVLDSYYKSLLVYPLGKSRVIAVEFQSEDPKFAADVANRIAEEYLAREEGAKNQTSRVTSEWLDKAIEPLMKKVVAAEGKVEAFRASKGLFVGPNNTTITQQQLGELNSQLSLARSQQADLQARAKLIREALRLGKVFETSEINNNELVRRLLEQRASLKAQIAFEERTLLPGHPRMKELSSQLADLETQVRAAAERAARAFENDARTAGARVASMQAELDSQKKATALSNEDEVQLKSLEREAAALREQLNSYRNKFLDAAARSTESAQPADARVISRALPQSEPTFPKKLPIVLLVTLGTLVLCSTLIATQALMAQQAAASRNDAMFGYDAPDYPDVATHQMASGGPEPLPWEKPAKGWPGFTLPFGLGRKKSTEPSPDHGLAMPATAELRTRQPSGAAEDLARELAMMDFNGRGKVVMVLGASAAIRTGLTTLRFARRLADDGASIVLDLAAHGVAGAGGANLYSRILPLDAGRLRPAGLASYLDRAASLGDVIHKDSRSRLHVIPAGGPLAQRIATLGSREDIATLIEALRHSYTHVVVDCGIVGGAGEFLVERGDVLVLVAGADSDDDFLSRIVERLEALRDAPVLLMSEDSGAEHGAANDSYPSGVAGNA